MLNAEYWRDMNKIFLIGFMGAGKTHWGKRLASGKGCAFADTDTETERTADAPVSAIFEASGEAGFRLLERESLRRLCADPRPMIVATGGGLPCFFDNMDQMRRHGCTIYLKMPVTVLAERIGQAQTQRPLLNGLTADTLPPFIEQRLAARAPWYEQAHEIVEYDSDESVFLEHLLAAISNHPFPA